MRKTRFCMWLAVLIVSTGCAKTSVIMPKPWTGIGKINASAPAKQQRVEIVYATDRSTSESSPNAYDARRHAAMAYGIATLTLAPELQQGQLTIEPQVQERAERARFPASPYPFDMIDDRPVISSDVGQLLEQHRSAFGDMLRARLTASDKKDVVMFVHGFNNGFDVAASTLAGLWHFSGRHGVPLLYSWPASHGGLRGYFVDRESGEFTIFHLKELLRTLFALDELRGIHIIAHSRGTDVVTSALRELLIENRGGNGNPMRDFRIKNLILAAPDLDFGIIRQRLMAEAFGTAVGQVTIYTSASDRALGLSQVIMDGIRFGLLGADDVEVRERRIFKSVGNVDFVRVENVSGFVGHAYYYKDPRVSSDIIRIITEGAAAGSVRRPLKRTRENFFSLPEHYLRPLAD